MMQPPCKRCLLSEIDPDGVWKTIQRRIALMPESEKASPEHYKSRLDICRKCPAMREGICAACGCFIELRAAGLTQHCPNRKW